MLCWLLAAALALGCARAGNRAVDAGPAAEASAVDSTSAYLALGDSLAVGVGATDRATTSYVSLVYRELRRRFNAGGGALDPPRLINLGVSGETSASMRTSGQLTRALDELRARNGNAARRDDVRAITIDIGGNDAAWLTPSCIEGYGPRCAEATASALEAFAANFDHILGELRGAAGARTPIVAMTVYNPLLNPACRLHDRSDIADIVLEGSEALDLPRGLNDVIRDVAERHDVQVAEVANLLGATGTTSDCLHADDEGYALIAAHMLASLAG